MVEAIKRIKKKVGAKAELPIITISTLVLLSLIIGISGYISYGHWITDVETEQLQKLTQLQAQQQASTIEVFLQEQQQQINLFAARSSMVTIANSDSSNLIRTAVGSLKRAFDESSSVRVFSLDRQERISGDDSASLSFAELDMINRAERGLAVPAEAVKTGEQWQLLFIAPIQPKITATAEADVEQREIQGTLLVSLPSELLFSKIANNHPELGQTRLLRRTLTRPALIHTVSQGDAGIQQQIDVANSEWIIQFSPSSALAEQASQSVVLVLLSHFLIGSLLLGGAYWLTGKVDPVRRPRPVRFAAVSESHASDGQQEDDVSSTMFDDQDILDIQLSEEDADLLSLEETQQPHVSVDSSMVTTAAIELPDQVFRAYDIRGLAGSELSDELTVQIGQAIGSEALAAGESSLFVARDGRTHSPELTQKLIEGILSTGCNVINIGAVPTPLLYFACCEFPDSNSGVMVTASHNPAEYNGFKIVINGQALAGDEILQIKSRIMRGDVHTGAGEEVAQQVVPDYIDRIFSDVALAGDVKIVIDAGNGIAGDIAPLLFEELGCEVIPLYCDVDGTFPNHAPDPTDADNLKDLIAEVKKQGADLGVAFDGDADRLMVVTQEGEIIWPDRLLMLFAKDIVSRNPGADVIFDVKCTRELNGLISNYGGRPIMWKSGHSFMKAKMLETGALLGGEQSGHIFIKDRWYGFDDGMYACARLLEIMTLRDQDLTSLFQNFPKLPSTPELKVAVADSEKFKLVETLIQQGDFQNGKATTIDGLRVDFARGWGLVRASNTSAALTLRFEAEEEDIIEQMQDLFKRELLKVDASLQLPF